jgi:hypothetical protein
MNPKVITSMDSKKKILIVGAATLIVVGLVMAGSAADPAKGFAGKWGMHGGMGKHIFSGNPRAMENLGLPDNATREEVEGAMWAKQLKDLGLTEDSTLREYRQALQSRLQDDRQDMERKIIEKLGLPANATRADAMNAMHQWRNDSEGIMQGRGPGLGFGKGGCKGLGGRGQE